jgi:aspartate carbamoyltransferase catalytic subunit
MAPRRPRHLIDIGDHESAEIAAILDEAEALRRGKAPPQLSGHVMGLCFEHPSCRTQFGFKTAMGRLGGTAVELPPPYRQPAMSGHESWADLVRSVGAYAHVLVVRAAAMATLEEIARHAPVPVVNAGAGQQTHPTQSLIDLFAIRRRFGGVDGLRIGLMGELATSRSALSLLRLLARYRPAEMRLIHPGPSAPLDRIAATATDPSVWRDRGPDPDLSGLDVVYMAGFPAGAGELASDPVRRVLRQRLALTPDKAERIAAGALILCPLPRIDEIAPELDTHPAMAMFQQSEDGLWVRMAVVGALSCAQSPNAGA